MRRLQRTYYEDGTLRTEGAFLNGKAHGLHRRWHPNGMLAEELLMIHGVPDGVAKHWNEQGVLLGSFEIKNGTGVQCLWHPNGRLMGEFSWVDGQWTGRQRAYFEDGELAGETYWLGNEKVSRKRYHQACAQNPNLPRYQDKGSVPLAQPEKDPIPRGDITRTLAVHLLQGSRVREALAWLQESRQPSRSLGEATGQDQAIQLITKLYSLGAVTIHAVQINGDPAEDQNTGHLVIELPQEQKQRRKLLRFCGRLARAAGFDPEPDLGQRYMLVTLD